MIAIPMPDLDIAPSLHQPRHCGVNELNLSNPPLSEEIRDGKLNRT